MCLIQIFGTEKYGEAFGKSLKHGRADENVDKNTDVILKSFENISKGFTFGNEETNAELVHQVREEFGLSDLDIASEHGRKKISTFFWLKSCPFLSSPSRKGEKLNFFYINL